MDKKLALQKAIERPGFKGALEFLRTGKNPGVKLVKDKLREEESDKVALIEVAVERGKRAEKAEKQAEAIGEVVGHTRFLYADRKAQKIRRGKAAREAGRDTKDSGLWDRYEASRSMKRHLDLARKENRRLTQLQAAQRVIDASDKKITVDAKTLVRYFRDWLKKPKRINGSD